METIKKNHLERNTMTRLRKPFALVAMLAAFGAATCSFAAAAQSVKIRVANFPNSFVLPMFYASEKGYFKNEGVDVEIMPYQTGPSVVSAVTSGEADIAWSASIPPIQARANGVPVKFFLTGAQEVPEHPTLWLLATGKSGLKSIADLKGKTVMINANGGGCEISLRTNLAKAGLQWTDVKRLVVPFPQMQAALELGKADAACAIEPFFHSILATPAIGAKVLAAGLLAESNAPVLSNGFFAREDWLKKNADAATRFLRAYALARKDLEANRDLQNALATKVLGISPELAATVDLIGWTRENNVLEETVKPMIDAMFEAKQIKAEVAPADVVETLPVK